MKKATKKPIEIGYIILTKENIKEVYELVNNEIVIEDKPYGNRWDDFVRVVISNGLNIPTLEDGKDKRAKHVADIGDYIIKGIKGEFYPCKPDIFKLTYDFEVIDAR
jgi:hypothetical protein